MALNVLTKARAHLLPPIVVEAPSSAPADPEALAPSAVQRALRLSVGEGALANVHINITTGAFLTGFALLLGASSFELGLIGAAPFLGQLSQFGGAYLQERLGERRRMVTVTAVLGRALWLPMALLPFLDLPPRVAMLIFILLLALSHILQGMALNGWLSWMTDLVPPKQRGAYFGARNTVCTVATMVSTWLAGGAIDAALERGDAPLGYLLIFGFSVLCGLLAGVLLWRQPEPQLRRQRQAGVSELFGAPLRNASFRSFCLIATGWGVVTGIAGPFFNAYGIETLQLSVSVLATMAIVTGAITLVTMPIVGRLQDRYGDRRVLVLSALGVILLPWGWVLSTPDFLLPVWVTTVVSGVFWPGITQGLSNLLMERAPAEGRGSYMAAHSVISGFGTMLANIAGGLIAAGIGAAVLHLGLLNVDHYTILFIASSLGRAVMVVIFLKWL